MNDYAGAYDDEEAAARAYDLAALKYWGPGTLINFPVNHRTILYMASTQSKTYIVFELYTVKTSNCHLQLIMNYCYQVSDYTRDLEDMQTVSREEYLASLRRYTHKLRREDALSL